MTMTTDIDDDDDTIFGNYVVPDGGSVRVPLFMCDAVQRAVRVNLSDTIDAADAFDVANHQPHFATDTTDARRIARDAREQMIRRAENAWRDAPQPDIGTSPEQMRAYAQGRPDLGPGHLSGARERSYSDYKARLEQAWRGRADPGAATQIERQGEQWRGGR